MSTSGALPPAAPTGPKAAPSALTYAQDFRNTLSTNPGPDTELSLPEGIYTVRDDITLGAVPAHPNFQSTPSNNVLDTRPPPPTSAPILCTTAALPVKNDFPFEDAFQLSNLEKSLPDQATSPSKSPSSSRFKYLASGNLKAYVSGDQGASTLPGVKETKEPIKRRKPKTGITKSNSSLVSRATPHDNLQKRLNDRGPDDLFAFVNNSRSFLWMELSSTQKADQLTKIMFTKGHPLCHDVNLTTMTTAPKAMAHLDVIMGFSTGDIMWYEPMSQKYSRINKRGAIHQYPVSCIKWIPGSENLFVAAHFDGTVVIYDKERDDAPFQPEEDAPRPTGSLPNGYPRPFLGMKKSQNSKNQKANPVAMFKPSNKTINGMSCSPDGRFLATAGEDFGLRVIDLMREKLTDVYYSFFGGFNTVAWSPDGKLLVTGSQDDLVTIWSFEDRTILARCSGHKSWVSSVAFDPWRCDGEDYRFGSVGLDCRLLLWDYSAALVNGVGTASIRPSIASTANLHGQAGDDAERPESAENQRPGSHTSSEHEETMVHPIAKRKEVATLQPVFNKKVDDNPLSWIGFQEHSIITSSEGGRIRTYNRPT